jgi:dTDP-4-amino-4,6-dideoxygalactose transaminase
MMFSRHYRFPAIRPVLPPPPRWLPYLEASYNAGWFSNFGPLVCQFEAALTNAFCHAGEAMISANSCTSGIAAALIASDVEGRVILPAFTFPATLSATVMAGAEPHVLDVELDTWMLDPAALEDALRSCHCGAVILVMPLGIAANYQTHAEICRHHGVPLIIDNAAGLGADRPTLPDGCFEVFSMHATKPFAIGEGGAICSSINSSTVMRRALNFGIQRGVEKCNKWGINGKLPEISAAVGLAALEEFASVITRRQLIAARYAQLIGRFEEISCRQDIKAASWQVFPVVLPSATVAEAFIQTAASNELEIRRAYRPPLDRWPRAYAHELCPNAQSLSDRIVCLPIYSDMTQDEAAEVLSIVGATLDRVLARKGRAA